MKRSLAGNMAYNALLAAVNIAYPVLLLPRVLRVLGPDAVGLVSWAASIAAYFALAANLGMATFAMRGVARLRQDPPALAAFAGRCFTLLILSSAAATAAYAALAFAVPAFAPYRAVFLLLGAQVAMGAFALDWLFAGLERFRALFLRNLAIKAACLVATYVLINGPGDSLAYAGVLVFGLSGANLINLAAARRLVRLRPVLAGLSGVLPTLRAALPLFALSLVVSVYQNLPVTVFGFFAPHDSVGYYATAYRIAQILVSIAGALVAALLPRMAALAERGDAGYGALFRRFYTVSAFLACFLAAVTFACADAIVLVLSGAGFAPAAPFLRELALLVLLSGLSTPLVHMAFLPQGREGAVFAAAAAGAVLSTVAAVGIVPLAGFRFATLGVIAAEAVILGVLAWRARGLRDAALPWSALLRLLAAAALVGAALYGAGAAGAGPFVVVFALAPAAFAAYYLACRFALRLADLSPARIAAREEA